MPKLVNLNLVFQRIKKNETIRELCVVCVKGTLTYDFPKIVAQFESHVLLCFVVTYSLYGLIMKCCCHVKMPPAV